MEKLGGVRRSEAEEEINKEELGKVRRMPWKELGEVRRSKKELGG